jgi:hypoxanthine phosphoribosyltransferase
VPTRLLSDILDVKRIASIGLTYTDSRRTRLGSYSLPQPIDRGHVLLLIEDVLETGASLVHARNILADMGAAVRTASLWYRAKSIIVPDFSLGLRDDQLSFPWEELSPAQ